MARTVPIADPGDLLAALPDRADPARAGGRTGSEPMVWVRHGSGLAASGVTARVRLPAGEDRFTAAETWLRELFAGADVDDQVRRPGTGPVAFGSFTFDPVSEGSVLIVPRTVLGRDGSGGAWLTTIRHTGDPLSLRRRVAFCSSAGGPGEPSLPGVRPVADGLGPVSRGRGERAGGRAADDRQAQVTTVGPAGVRWHDGARTGAQWERAVAAAVTAIRSGRLAKVVLARDSYATAADPFDAHVVLRRLAERNPDCFTFACANLVGATPELLVRRRGTEVSALVLGGTAPRGARATEDARRAADLLASAKDTEEHGYAVASIREALSPLCRALEVPPRPSLVTLASLHHLGTWVRGSLAVGRSALALAGALHPPAAVCGTPTEAAMELIRELEGMDRGRYAGPVGWVDAMGNGEWGIALRCALLAGRQARLFAGCGIVAGSDPAAELAETEVKFRPMREALQG